jgi:hypothetical protein
MYSYDESTRNYKAKCSELLLQMILIAYKPVPTDLGCRLVPRAGLDAVKNIKIPVRAGDRFPVRDIEKQKKTING